MIQEGRYSYIFLNYCQKKCYQVHQDMFIHILYYSYQQKFHQDKQLHIDQNQNQQKLIRYSYILRHIFAKKNRQDIGIQYYLQCRQDKNQHTNEQYHKRIKEVNSHLNISQFDHQHKEMDKLDIMPHKYESKDQRRNYQDSLIHTFQSHFLQSGSQDK